MWQQNNSYLLHSTVLVQCQVQSGGPQKKWVLAGECAQVRVTWCCFSHCSPEMFMSDVFFYPRVSVVQFSASWPSAFVNCAGRLKNKQTWVRNDFLRSEKYGSLLQHQNLLGSVGCIRQWPNIARGLVHDTHCSAMTSPQATKTTRTCVQDKERNTETVLCNNSFIMSRPINVCTFYVHSAKH